MKERSDWTESFGALANVGSPSLLFVAGFLICSTVGNSVYGLVSDLVGEGPGAKVLVIVLCALLCALAVAIEVARRQRGFSVEGGGLPPPSRGLICLVSNRESLLHAVAHHASCLERLWLIHTAESRDLAKDLRLEIVAKHGLARDCVEPKEIGDVKLQGATEQAVNAIFLALSEYHLKDTDVICDFTGLTKPASAGMIAACLSRSRKLQYTPFDYTPDAKGQMRADPTKPLDPVYIHIVR